MSKRILILGKGFIGGILQKELSCQIDGSRVNSYNDAERLLKKYRPQILINCIGVNGKRNVDDCELEKDRTLLANSFVPIILAESCLRRKVKLVNISSGCIFNYDYKKNRPLTEECQDYFFKLFYSRSKIYSERALAVLARDYNILILRIRIPLLAARHPKNLLDKLIRYKKVIDIPNSVTYMPDFVRAVKHLLKIDARGVYNLVNRGGLRYPDLMKVYQKYVPEFRFRVIQEKKLKLVRTNLVLSVRKLENAGFNMRDVNAVLEECVKGYLKS